MLNEIKKKIEKELIVFINDIDKYYALNELSPFLFKTIKDFVLRPGKRIRPILFVIGYLGYAKKEAKNLYSSALSIELLHDFMLVHDDIIDKSDTRRGEPSMHETLNRYLKNSKNAKFNGQDLTIVVGDIMYAMAIQAFLAINEDMQRKEIALKKFIEAAVYTGSGEFIELLYGIKEAGDAKREDIYKIYDYKTAYYTFSTPLTSGAILAGAKKDQVNKLFKYGIYLGRAFQIKDDILGLFCDEKKIGKSSFTDLREGKKTILIWYAYNNSTDKIKSTIKKILSKPGIDKNDLTLMRELIEETGALGYAKKEIKQLSSKALSISAACGMRKPCIELLNNYSQKLLEV